MDSVTPRINEWPSPETHLRVPVEFTQNQTISDDSHHEQKDIEHANTNNQQSSLLNLNPQILNDENRDTNVPFHLTHSHLKQNHTKLDLQATSNSLSPQTTESSTPSNHNYQANIHRHIMHTQHGHEYHPITTPIRSAHRTPARSHYHSRPRNSGNDKLQRKLQKLEQEILSKNIQHDIMVNKEEMMAKRLKTKDIRIKNLQNDIHKLRDQLTDRNELHDKLVNETTELREQNRGLNSKLRASNISSNSAMTEDNKYNESTRDILLRISDEIKYLKQPNQANNEQANQLKDAFQSSLVPLVQQMKVQEREFMNRLKNEQSEWMNNISLQINENMSKYDGDNNNNEMINIFCNKLDEMDKNNKPRLNNMFQHIKKQEIKLDSLNTNYFQTFFDENTKLITQKQKIVINELKQDLKREIYSTKTELISDIKKTKNELISCTKKSKNEIDSNINKLSNDIKYPIPINSNNENINNSNINNDILSDIMNESALKVSNLEETINKLCKKNRDTTKYIQQQIATQNNKFQQISDENALKTTNAIRGLEPFFDKLYKYFQETDDNVKQSMQENNNDMIQSFAKFKHEFTKIVESININKEYPLLLKEMKIIKENMNKSDDKSEFNAISKNMQQITRRHDEIVKIITNTVPNANDSNKMSEMYNNLLNAIESMNKMNANNYQSAPQKNVYNGTGTDVVSEESVNRIKSMIISQIEEMKKSFISVDDNLRVKLDKLLQEINSRNISLFNNIKQLNEAQQQYILKEAALNNKQLIKTHESVLKSHLQQIQLRLSQLNKTQITLSKSVTKTDENINNYNKIETMINNLNNNLGEIFEKHEIKKTAKDVQVYIRNDMMKEVQLIKNLCNDIHKKSQQLPHFVARNKDLKKFEQMFEDFTQNSMPTKSIKNDSFGSILMVQLKSWCENILSQITNNRNNCSVYVVIYIWSQIVFNTFLDPNENNNDDVKEKENGNENENDILSEIQSRGYTQLDNIYNNMENDEFDLEIMIENLVEWMQNLLSNENICNLWITRTGHEMKHFCQKEFEINKKLVGIKNKINQIIQKQSKTCWRMSVFQPMILCAPILFVLFGLWLNSIQNQQNTYW